MHVYFFVWDRQTDTYPLRYWVSDDKGAAPPPELAEMDGTLTQMESDDMVEELAEAWPEPRYVVGEMAASSFDAVRRNFKGLHFY